MCLLISSAKSYVCMVQVQMSSDCYDLTDGGLNSAKTQKALLFEKYT